MHVYFDSVSMFVFFLLAGRYLEMRARHRAGDLTDALARLTPPFADRRRDDGTLSASAFSELRVGDCVHVERRRLVPADGALLSERCSVDEALLSGESAPVAKRRGDMLIAGAFCGWTGTDARRARGRGYGTGRHRRVGGACAGATPATGARRRTCRGALRRACSGTDGADRRRVEFRRSIARVYGSAGCAGRVLSLRVCVGCPGAITRALAVLARRGVLVVKPDAIQALAEATHVVFDKTGTLTEPQLALADVETFNGVSRERHCASLQRSDARAVIRSHAPSQLRMQTHG